MSQRLSNLKLGSGSGLLSGLSGGKILGTLSGGGLKRSWIVIVGDDAPVGEVNNADALTKVLRRKLNVTPMKAWNSTKIESRTQLSKYPNILIVGGPIASKFAYDINELLDPKCYFAVAREFQSEGHEEETWTEYVQSGGITTQGFDITGVKLAGAEHSGIIGVGTQKMGVRSSQVVALWGWTYEDTCVLAKAFTEGVMEAGAYNCLWTAKVPNRDANPEGMSYTKRT